MENDSQITIHRTHVNLNDAKKYEGKVKKNTRYYTDIKEETVTKAGICYVINFPYMIKEVVSVEQKNIKTEF